MKNRKEIELFSIAFLDVLFGALGAIIFLFIIVPKGGKSPDPEEYIVASIDAKSQKVFGGYDDYSKEIQLGDTLRILVASYGNFPIRVPCPPQTPCPEVQIQPEVTTVVNQNSNATSSAKGKEFRPSVPAKFSIEMHWEEESDNVDLFVCKGNLCVFGAKRNLPSIGTWDSGVQINTFKDFWRIKNLRTNMEAVRQVQELVPGVYKVYGQFKSTDSNKKTIDVSSIVYSEKSGEPQVEFLEFGLSLNPGTSESARKLLMTIQLDSDGSFSIIKN
jgi:hypothetical protein